MFKGSGLVQTRRDGSTMTLAQSKRASELQNDINQWEENRLFRSGVVRLREVRPLLVFSVCISCREMRPWKVLGPPFHRHVLIVYSMNRHLRIPCGIMFCFPFPSYLVEWQIQRTEVSGNQHSRLPKFKP